MRSLARTKSHTRGLLGRALLVAVSLALLAPASTLNAPPARAATPVALTGPLHVSGGHIYDGLTSTPVVLRGVNFDGAQTAVGIVPHTYFPDENTINHMHAWGANLLRLELSEDYWNAAATLNNPALARQVCPGETYDRNYQSEVADTVNYATSLGMAVIIDLHASNPNCLAASSAGSTTPTKPTPGGGSPPLPGQGATTFWSDISHEFSATSPAVNGANNGLVLFELYNEPHVCFISGSSVAQGQNPTTGCPQPFWVNDENNTHVWAKGATIAYQNSSYDGVGLDTLFTQVRLIAPNVILVDPNGNAEDPYTLATDWFRTRTAISVGSNVAIAAHLYPAMTTCDWVSGFVDWFSVWAHTFTSAPIVWDEFGWADPNSGQANTTMVNYFDATQQSFAAFAFDASPDSSGNPVAYALLSSVPGHDASANGQPVKEALSSTSGTVGPTPCAPGAPYQVTGLQAAPMNAGLALSWVSPANAYTDATTYTVSVTDPAGVVRLIPARCTKASVLTPGTCDLVLVTGLTNGVAYQLSVQAANPYGPGAWSTPVSASPSDQPPGAPTNVTATSGNSTNAPGTGPGITVTWVAPDSGWGSPVTEYTIVAQDANNSYAPVSSVNVDASTRSTMLRLAPGLYRMVVYARNNAGQTPGYPAQGTLSYGWRVAPS